MKLEATKEPHSQSYHRVATQGAFWNVGFAVANKVVTLVGQLMLAWLLSPKDMGLAGMAIAIAGFMTIFSASGIGDVLVQRKNFNRDAGQGLWLSAFLVLCMAGAIALMAPLAIWSGRRDLTGLLIVVALGSLSSMANPVLHGKLKSKLDFKHLAVSQYLAGVTNTISCLIFAWLGFGPYSLVLPIIPQGIVSAAYIIWREGWPKFEKPNIPMLRELFKPTFSLAITGFLSGLQTQAPIFCVGLLLNSTLTGYFSWGWSVAGQAVFLLAINLRQVLMPVFVKMGTSPERQVIAAFKAARIITVFLTLVCGLQALLAEPLIKIFLPAKWLPAGPIISFISLGLCLQGVLVSVSAWLNATGQYRQLLWVNLVPAVLGAGSAYFGALNWGVNGAAACSAIGMIVGALFSMVFVPWSHLRSETVRFFLPLILTCFVWVICRYFLPINSPFLLQFLVALTFLVAAGGIWWSGDDGSLKKLARVIK